MVRLLLVPLLLAAGCDELFYSGLDPSSTAELPVFDFGRHHDLTGSAKLSRFAVVGRPLDTAAWTTFWEIQVEPGERFVVVDRLTYGETPPGFVAAVPPAAALPPCHVYAGNGGFHGVGQDCYFLIDGPAGGPLTISPLSEAEFRAITENPGGG